MLVPKLCFPKNPDPSSISHRIFFGCQSQPENGKVRRGNPLLPDIPGVLGFEHFPPVDLMDNLH